MAVIVALFLVALNMAGGYSHLKYVILQLIGTSGTHMG